MTGTLTILGSGTSQGVPVIACDCEVCSSVDERDYRTRTSAMISINGQYIFIYPVQEQRKYFIRPLAPAVLHKL